MNGHPSSLQLERFSVDDLPVEAQEKTRTHVQSCPECRQALDQLEQARGDCSRKLPEEKLLERIAESRRHLRARWSWVGFGTLTAAAAGLAVFLLSPRPERVQLKG